MLFNSSTTMPVIIGNGDVGKALNKVLSNKFSTVVFDREDDLLPLEGESLHICFPYSQSFVKEVKRYIKFFKPSFVVIHSTVPCGTCNKIDEFVVHSPIRGRHQELEKSLKTFVKYVASHSKVARNLARKELEQVGLKVKTFDDPRITELAKILSTTYYGLCIIFAKEVEKLCQKYNLSFDKVYSEWNKTYNEGYSKMNLFQFVRPILKATAGEIGGHCVIPNARILRDEFVLAKQLLKLNDSYGLHLSPFGCKERED